MSDRAQFDAAWKTIAVPRLEALGFAGSMPSWLRQRGDVLHIVELQHMMRGDPVAWINFGVHLAFVPTCVPVKGKMREASCDLRERLSDEAGNQVSIPYGPDPVACVEFAWREFAARGLPQLERLARFPDDFVRLRVEDINGSLLGLSAGGRAGLFLARCLVQAGERERAREVAELALQTAAPHATIYQQELRTLLALLNG